MMKLKTQILTNLKNKNSDKRHNGLQCKQFKHCTERFKNSALHFMQIRLNDYEEEEKHNKIHIKRHHIVYFKLCLSAVKFNLCTSLSVFMFHHCQ